jgi:hypothetical protein
MTILSIKGLLTESASFSLSFAFCGPALIATTCTGHNSMSSSDAPHA